MLGVELVSAATPSASHKLSALRVRISESRLQSEPVKLPSWPNTRLAATPVELGTLNSSVRLLSVSPTYRFPSASVATWSGRHIVLADGKIKPQVLLRLQ